MILNVCVALYIIFKTTPSAMEGQDSNDRGDKYNSSDLRLALYYCHNNNLEYKQ
jgi:hypothetical protein